MSAPHIPNLLNIRGGPRQRAGSRGRGGRGNYGGYYENQSMKNDLDIQGTDNDAAVSRLSAVSVGYLEDAFAQHFVQGPGTRRMPVINRGTYARTTAIDILINAFLAPDSNGSQTTKQIISLGAGTDTRYFRLRAKSKDQNLIYHEFDFPDVAALKYEIVAKKSALSPVDPGLELFRTQPNTTQSSPDQEPEWGFRKAAGNNDFETKYCFHPMDLRKLAYSTSRGLASFRGIRSDVPTLLISECCLCYLEVETAELLVKFFEENIASLGIILYEPIGVDDAFGKTMVANLAARNIKMPTVQAFKTLEDQKTRIEEYGFKADNGNGGSDAVDIDTVWNKWVPDIEKNRVDKLEGLDEVEEWQVLGRHYAIVWGWKGSGWDNWSEVKKESNKLQTT